MVTVFGWFLIPYTKPFLKEVIAFGLFSTILFGIYCLIKPSQRKIVLILATLLLSVLAFIKLTFYHHYAVKLSSSALFVIFETNAEESSDFLSNYLDNFVVLIFSILFIPLLWVIIKLFKKSNSISENNKFFIFKRSKYFNLLLIIGIALASFLIYKKFTEFNILFTSIASYTEYTETKAVLKNSLAKRESEYVKVDSSLQKPQTYIVIIGESTSTWHMELYGYNRKTNPLLSEIRNELVIFDDVITPNVHTILALDKILTLSDYENPNKKENASVVQLANQSGFSTYWISNQRPVGFHESVSTLIANAASKKYFLTTDNYNSNIYDENVLPVLKNILNEKDDKKMIFIHLIGTHSNYDKRYPSSFNHFEGPNIQTKIQNSSSEKIVNEYDNAIRYNDYVVRNIINLAQTEDKVGYVLYFADHGDEVYDTMNLMGHNEYHSTKPMYEVPFIVWLSDKYKEQRPDFSNLNAIENRKYNLEDFIHSFADLSFIKFSLQDSTRSIFNTSYQSRTRWIKKNEDYDKR